MATKKLPKNDALIETLENFDRRTALHFGLGMFYVTIAVANLALGFFLNLHFLDTYISGVVDIIPINVFMLSGVTLFSGLAFFHLRISRDGKDKILDIYSKNFLN